MSLFLYYFLYVIYNTYIIFCMNNCKPDFSPSCVINYKYYHLYELLLGLKKWAKLKMSTTLSLRFQNSGRCRSWVRVAHVEILSHKVTPQKVLTYRHWQWVSREKNDHLTSLLRREMVQLFLNVVCKALQKHRKWRAKSKWEERGGRKRQHLKNESHAKHVRATLKNQNSLFKKLPTVQSLLFWFVIKMAHNGFGGLGNLMGNF